MPGAMTLLLYYPPLLITSRVRHTRQGPLCLSFFSCADRE